MDPNERVAYIQSQVACAMIEALGMQAENQQRLHQGAAMAYVEKDFLALIDKYALGCNSVIAFFRP